MSSASSVRVALREPWRANPPRPPAEPGAAPAGSLLLAVLGAADADDTADDCDTGMGNDSHKKFNYLTHVILFA